MIALCSLTCVVRLYENCNVKLFEKLDKTSLVILHCDLQSLCISHFTSDILYVTFHKSHFTYHIIYFTFQKSYFTFIIGHFKLHTYTSHFPFHMFHYTLNISNVKDGLYWLYCIPFTLGFQKGAKLNLSISGASGGQGGFRGSRSN